MEALPSQELLHWVTAHVHLFEYLGGVPEILVPDNLRSGVTKAHRYEPEVNPTYLEMAAYYGVSSCFRGRTLVVINRDQQSPSPITDTRCPIRGQCQESAVEGFCMPVAFLFRWGISIWTSHCFGCSFPR